MCICKGIVAPRETCERKYICNLYFFKKRNTSKDGILLDKVLR